MTVPITALSRTDARQKNVANVATLLLFELLSLHTMLQAVTLSITNIASCLALSSRRRVSHMV